ncbi:integrin alpha-X-like [Scyliorhinus torazame]|uniref:integrin alpha-X-like n=1 Tax=Scyliorhinus torazame TaxID=75743 RepID=UPI003B5BB753
MQKKSSKPSRTPDGKTRETSRQSWTALNDTARKTQTNQQKTNMIATSWTRIFCDVANLERNHSIEFRLLGVARSLGKVGSDAKLEMKSQAHILLDETRFVDIYSPTSHWAQAVTEVEFQKYYNQLTVVIGSSVGGFILLVIVIIVLYKCGFFKRNYRDKFCDAGEEASSPFTSAGVDVTAPGSKDITPTSDSLKPMDSTSTLMSAMPL